MTNPEYWRISAECVDDALSLQLTDEQLQDLAEMMYDTAQMESEATGQHIFTKKMSKKCPQCGGSDLYIEELCPYHIINFVCRACGHSGEESEFTGATLFDRLAQSPEEMAPKFIYEATTCDGGGHVLSGYKSTITTGFWVAKSEALAATVEKLKEVADE